MEVYLVKLIIILNKLKFWNFSVLTEEEHNYFSKTTSIFLFSLMKV